jgi:hypothetical protein
VACSCRALRRKVQRTSAASTPTGSSTRKVVPESTCPSSSTVVFMFINAASCTQSSCRSDPSRRRSHHPRPHRPSSARHAKTHLDLLSRNSARGHVEQHTQLRCGGWITHHQQRDMPRAVVNNSVHAVSGAAESRCFHKAKLRGRRPRRPDGGLGAHHAGANRDNSAGARLDHSAAHRLRGLWSAVLTDRTLLVRSPRAAPAFEQGVVVRSKQYAIATHTRLRLLNKAEVWHQVVRMAKAVPTLPIRRGDFWKFVQTTCTDNGLVCFSRVAWPLTVAGR